MTSTLISEKQKLDQNNIVQLCTLDATALGDTIHYFTDARNGTVTFGGIAYSPIEFKAEGFEIRRDGAPSTPTLQISVINNFIPALVRTYNNGLGAVFTRTRTYRMFLDDGTSADSTQHFPTEIYYVDRKKTDDGEIIEWELTSVLDQEGLEFPIRTVVRGYCDYIYRRYNAGTSSFITGECPYASTDAGAYFTVDGVNTVNPALDVCGKRLSDCKLRFGTNAILPYRGFPGVSRIR